MPERQVGYARNSKISRKLSKDMQKKLQMAKDRLMFGQQYRAHRREGNWRRSIEQYENLTGWDTQFAEDMDIVNVNLSFSTINTLVPYVSDENPRFLVSPSSGDATAESAAALDLMMNTLWRDPEVEGQQYVSAAVWDSLVLGDGYIQVVYELVENEQYTEKGDVLSGRGDMRNKYTVERVSPWDLWIDPYSDGLHNARWAVRRILYPISELKQDDRYKIIDDLEGSDVAALDYSDPEEHERLQYTYADEGWVEVFEFYNIQEKWMLAFTMSGEHPLRYIEGIRCPIYQMPNYRIYNSPYHVGELENIYSLQLELNRTRSEMVTHRRRNTAKWMVRKDAISQEGMEALRSNIINDIVPIEGNVSFAEALEALEPQQLNPDAYAQDQIIHNDINEITGVNEYLRGQPQDISRTATEASIIEGATNVRTRHKLNQVERFLRRIGQGLLDTIADTLPQTPFEEMRLYVTGVEAERLLRAVGAQNPTTDAIFEPSAETFIGRYVVDVERGSAELRNPMQQEARAKEMFQIVLSSMPVLQQFGVSVNLRAFLEEWLKATNIEDINRFLAPDEQQAMLQQASLMQAMQGAQPQGPPGGGNGVATGSRTPQGQPREATSGPPTAMINPNNSGMLPLNSG